MDLETFDNSIIDQLNSVWASMPAANLYGVYDAIGYDSETSHNLYCASTVVYLAALCKEKNITQSWLARRKDMISRAFQDCNLDEYYTLPIISLYTRLYPRDKIDPDRLYQQLTVMWSAFKEQSHSPLMWIIE